MTGVSALWQVALREIRERGRSRAYLVTTGLTILIVVGLIVVPGLFASETDESTVGVVGAANQPIIDTAMKLANADDESGGPPSLTIDTVRYPDRDAAVSGLEDGDVDAVLVDGNEVIVESNTGFAGPGIADRLQRAASANQIEDLVSKEGQGAADVVKLLTSDALDVTTLTGGGTEDESRTVVAYFGLLLLYVAILLYGTWILTGVTEEKSNRVVEVLLSSVRPWQILGGKILGIGSLALTQLLGTILVAVVALKATGAFDLPPIEVSSVLNLVLWFLLGFLIFAMLFGAAGSLVSRMEDAQTIAMPMSMTAVVGFFISIMSLSDPTGALAVIGTFIPVTAPFVVPVRTALAAIPAWQYILSVLISLASIGLLTVAAGRIYSGGLLRFGTKVGWREAWRSANE